MVSRAVRKTWPSGLSYDKNLGLRPRFLSTESLGPCFSHGTGDHDQIPHYVSCDTIVWAESAWLLHRPKETFGALVNSDRRGPVPEWHIMPLPVSRCIKMP